MECNSYSVTIGKLFIEVFRKRLKLLLIEYVRVSVELLYIVNILWIFWDSCVSNNLVFGKFMFCN